jgi:DNA-binding beta-propeller fold protein YncE
MPSASRRVAALFAIALITAPNGDIFVSDGHSGQNENPPPNANGRIVKFTKNGKYIKEWGKMGSRLYAIDSESSATRHPDWKTGVRIGSTKEDKVLAFIPPHQTNNPEGAAGEGVAVDPEGNVYAAEGPISRPAAGSGLTKYVKR